MLYFGHGNDTTYGYSGFFSSLYFRRVFRSIGRYFRERGNDRKDYFGREAVRLGAVIGLLIVCTPVFANAAIAFDAYSGVNDSGSPVTTLTYAATVTGTNPILFVWVLNITDSSDSVTGVTWNGNAMTQIETTFQTTPEREYLYAIAAPTTGTHNVVVSVSSKRIFSAAVSYTGAQQSLPLDNHTNATTNSATALSATLTTVANNAWTVAFLRTAETNTVSPAAGTTLRNVSVNSVSTGDSNGPITPAGSTSLGMTGAGTTGEMGIVMASFAPAATSVPTPPFSGWWPAIWIL